MLGVASAVVDAGPVPAVVVAETLNVYGVELTSPVTVMDGVGEAVCPKAVYAPLFAEYSTR